MLAKRTTTHSLLSEKNLLNQYRFYRSVAFMLVNGSFLLSRIGFSEMKNESSL